MIVEIAPARSETIPTRATGTVSRPNSAYVPVVTTAHHRGIEAYEAVLRSLEVVETSTTYDWGDADPAEYRIGLDAASEGPEADRA